MLLRAISTHNNVILGHSAACCLDNRVRVRVMTSSNDRRSSVLVVRAISTHNNYHSSR